jgi:hypothetical protein
VNWQLVYGVRSLVVGKGLLGYLLFCLLSSISKELDLGLVVS